VVANIGLWILYHWTLNILLQKSYVNFNDFIPQLFTWLLISCTVLSSQEFVPFQLVFILKSNDNHNTLETKKN